MNPWASDSSALVSIVPSGTAIRRVRPSSAGIISASKRPLLQAATSYADEATSPAARPTCCSRASARHDDQFCHRFQSRPEDPRPPSASSGLRHRGSIATLVTHLGHGTRADTRSLVDKVARPSSAAAAPRHSGAISHNVMKEEIDEQRRFTRKTQLELHSLQQTLAQKQQELELLRHHVQVFDCAKPQSVMPRSKAKQQDTSDEVTDGPIAKLKNQIQRHDQYKKKLKHLHDRLVRQVKFIHANVALLQTKQTAAQRETSFYENKIVQERGTCAALSHKMQELQSGHATQMLNAMRLLDSQREEILSRAMVSHQRHNADRRRQDMLRLMEARPRSSTRNSLIMDSAATPYVGKRDSFRILSHSNGSADSGTMRLLLAGPPEFHQYADRENYFQLFERQYARALEATGETDLALVLERVRTFEMTKKQLLQVEVDTRVGNEMLKQKQSNHDQLLQHLRLSGIAEVEKRKKIRDYLEHKRHVKSLEKAQAKDEFLERLKLFSHVQQGIVNLLELLRCLDDRITPPSVSISALKPTSTPSSSGSNEDMAMLAVPSSPTEAVVLVTLLKFCLQVLRGNPSEPIVFTHDQVDRLIECIPDYDSRKLRKGSFTLEETTSTPTAAEGPTVKEDEGADDYSSESDNEDARFDIKKNTTETLQQVEALFHTLDTKQQIQATRAIAHQPRPFGLSALANQVHDLKGNPTTEKPLDHQAKLAAAQAFFKERRLYQRQEQQHRREFLSVLATKTKANTNDSSASGNSTAKARVTAALLAGATRKRSNAVVLTSTVGSPPRQPKPQQLASIPQRQQTPAKKPQTSVVSQIRKK